MSQNLSADQPHVSSVEIHALETPSLLGRMINICLAIQSILSQKQFYFTVAKVILSSLAIGATIALAGYIFCQLAIVAVTALSEINDLADQDSIISLVIFITCIVGYFSYLGTYHIYENYLYPSCKTLEKYAAEYRRIGKDDYITYSVHQYHSSCYNIDNLSVLNDQHLNRFIDPLSGKVLDSENKFKPRHIRIVDHVFDVESVIKHFLINNNLFEDTIMHPVKVDQILSEDEKFKLIKDLSQFFSCTRDQLKYITQLKLTTEEVRSLQFDSNQALKYIKSLNFDKIIAKNYQDLSLSGADEFMRWKRSLSYQNSLLINRYL